jgi:hypothetical protein
MIRKVLFLLSITFCTSLYPQEWDRSRLDSLFNDYVSIFDNNSQNLPQNQPDIFNIKCGFGTSADIFLHFNEFTASQQRLLKVMNERPVTDANIVSPDGFFRIHYNTTGPYVPQYDINEFAMALDSAYNFEVSYLGYPPPPPDTQPGIPPDSVGGDSKYDVYIINLSDYGITIFDHPITDVTSTSYMEVHYSFGTGFYTHGIDAARVTAAHEFHHAIQVGNYLYRDADKFFYELTSTSMEEFVFNTVNDYYGYMGSYFNHPDKAFVNYAGYELAVWNIFLKDIYGFDIIKRQWELLVSKRAIDAINTSLLERQSSYGKELNTFGIWTYFTGYRAKLNQYFPEASNYPLISTNSLTINVPGNFDAIKPTSNNHLETVSSSSSDTLTVILTNTDYLSGINNPSMNISATYGLYDHNNPGSIKLNDNYYEQLNVSDITMWLTSVILNGIVIKQDSTIYPPVVSNLEYAYPNPFRYNSSSANIINIPVKAPFYSKINLYIYSASMDLIFNKELQVTFGKDNTPIVTWDLDEVGKKLASGVYIFVAEANKEKSTGKLVIFNE